MLSFNLNYKSAQFYARNPSNSSETFPAAIPTFLLEPSCAPKTRPVPPHRTPPHPLSMPANSLSLRAFNPRSGAHQMRERRVTVISYLGLYADGTLLGRFLGGGSFFFGVNRCFVRRTPAARGIKKKEKREKKREKKKGRACHADAH